MSALPRGSTVRRDAGLYGYERALRRVGLDPIAGVDEAGRGACAGPLVAAAVILPDGKRGQVPGLADSKLLTAKARDRCYEEVRDRALAWTVVMTQSRAHRDRDSPQEAARSAAARRLAVFTVHSRPRRVVLHRPGLDQRSKFHSRSTIRG